MSATPVSRADVADVAPGGERRVRHQARDAAMLMAFSLAMSVVAAGAFVLLPGLLAGHLIGHVAGLGR